MKLLTPKQRSMLSAIASRAWRRLHDHHAIDETLDEWRHRVATATCGHTISTAPAAAFTDLYIAFKAEAGDTDEAYARAVSQRTNEQRQDLHNIRSALRDAGESEAFAVKIANDQWQRKLRKTVTSLETLPPFATRLLLYTVKARLRAKRKAA